MIIISLDKLPSIIRNTRFNKKGLAETESGFLVPAYVASEFGFHDLGREILDLIVYPNLREAGILPLCPFAACMEYLGPFPTMDTPLEKVLAFWDGFNSLIGPVNYETLMPPSRFMFAILDGSHSVDDGVAAEVSHFATHYRKRSIIGMRSDIRIAENIAAPINPAIRYLLDQGPYNNQFVFNPGAYKRSLVNAKDLADRLREAA